LAPLSDSIITRKLSTNNPMKTYEIIARIVVGIALVAMVAVHALGILAALASAIVATEPDSQPAQPEIAQPVLMAMPDSRLSVVELRTLARHRLGSSVKINGRRIAQSTRAQLLAALSAA
jgi:hypothetical protein